MDLILPVSTTSVFVAFPSGHLVLSPVVQLGVIRAVFEFSTAETAAPIQRLSPIEESKVLRLESLPVHSLQTKSRIYPCTTSIPDCFQTLRQAAYFRQQHTRADLAACHGFVLPSFPAQSAFRAVIPIFYPSRTA